eukprot:TRINITY_DN4120_c1_g1_i1.p1 TRINITY_DN4120_c1_g1~~TRINITY_DN4120_c1_g1_i1.p1  ORF type:complete len:787 (+),score=148.05 TRINITY_DN4120_c1_g1_i1:83-2362(+)
MAERLYAHQKSDLSCQLLASAYMSAGKINSAYHVVQNSTSEMNRYLTACCAYRLGKYREAERALTQCKDQTNSAVPNGAAGLFLLGLVCKKQDQKERATLYFSECLRENPFLWNAYENLISMGVDCDPEEFFGGEVAPDVVLSTVEEGVNLPPVTKQPSNPLIIKSNLPLQPSIPNLPSTSVSNTRTEKTKSCISTPSLANKLVKRVYNYTSPLGGTQDEDFELKLDPMFGVSLGQKYGNKSLPSPFIGSKTKEKLYFANPSTPSGVVSTPVGVSTPAQSQIGVGLVKKKTNQATSRVTDITPSANSAVKRGGNLFNNFETPELDNSRKNTKQDNKPSSSTVVPIVIHTATPLSETPSSDAMMISANVTKEAISNEAADSKANTSSSMSIDEESSTESQDKSESGADVQGEQAKKLLDGTVKVLTLFRTLGTALKYVNKFYCKKAISTLKKLDENQYRTGWVLTNIGRSYYEMGQYQNAEKEFKLVRELEPYRLEGMEIYSTVLWHLKQEVELSYLAQQVVDTDKNSPSSWCVVGNCFSLQGEKEMALKFFKRATSIDPSFTYAYTLAGHEYVAMENWDKGMACFRNAMRLDPRSYIAWYGLGTISYKQEKYTSAEYYFNKALQINPFSSVLYCFTGMVYHASKKYKEALKMLEKSVSLDPKNFIAKFKKASVLFQMASYTEALKLLEELNSVSQKEYNVFVLMGKIYKKLNQPDKAMSCFTTALDLDSKSSNYVKAAISKLTQPDGDSEEEDIELKEQ